MFDSLTVAITLDHIDLRLANTFARMVGEHLLSLLFDADLAPVDDLLIVGKMKLFVDRIFKLIRQRVNSHGSQHVLSCLHLGSVLVQARLPTIKMNLELRH